MKTLPILIACFFTVSTFADGISKDENGNLKHKHVKVDLTPSQLEEIEALNSVTFTKEQWAEVKKSSPNTPKRVQGIVSITWDDCLCGTRCEAILLKNNQLGIWHTTLSAKQIKGQVNYGQKREIMVDRNGNFHLNGVQVPYEMLIEAIRGSRPVDDKQKEVWQGDDAVVVAPPGVDLKAQPYADQAKTIYLELANKGWNNGKMHWHFSEED